MIIVTIGVLNNAVVNARQRPIQDLTVRDAAIRAEQRSRNMKNLDENIQLIDIQRPMLIYNASEAITTPQVISSAIQLMQSDMQRAALSGNLALQRQIIEISILRFFATVISAENDLELYDINLGLSEKNLEITNVRNNLGLISAGVLDTAKKNHENLVNNREGIVRALNSAYRALNQVMGTPPDTRYNLILNIEYTPLRERPMHSFISESLRKSVRLKTLEDEYLVAEFDYDHINSTDKKEQEIKLAQMMREIQDVRKEIEEKVRANYNDIKALELSYAVNNKELENMQNQRNIMKTQLELGRITQHELDTFDYHIMQLEYGILGIVKNHHIRVVQFDVPDLL